VSRVRGWTSASLVAALVVIAGGVLTSSAASTGASAFVPITPCRLFDTRPSPDTVGTRTTPLGPGETYTVPVWGTNGKCTLPSGITGISANVVILKPTADSFLTVFPADKPLPLAASLNWVAGQAPTPNAVTAALSATGTLSLYSPIGSVHVALDVVGYYEPVGSGLPGPTGPAGPTGPTGPRGFSAWDTIPSGVTVTGSIIYDDETAGGGASPGTNSVGADLPGSAPVALTNPNVAVGLPLASVDFDASCTGSSTTPTAPAGKLCIYVYSYSGLDATTLTAVAVSPAARAFLLSWTPAAGASPADEYLYASWAYTAP